MPLRGGILKDIDIFGGEEMNNEGHRKTKIQRKMYLVPMLDFTTKKKREEED